MDGEHFIQSSTLMNETINDTYKSLNRTDNNTYQFVPQVDFTVQLLSQIYHISLVYIVPVVIIVGLSGNVVSFSVFMFSYLRRLSSSTYLAALSLADFMFLLCAGVSWLNIVGIRWYHQSGLCEMFVFMTYVWSFLSVWFIVGFSTERYIAVCMPLRRQEMCTKRRARIVVLCLVILAFVFYSTTLWTTTTQKQSNGNEFCTIRPKYFRWVNIMNNADTIITLLIPVFTIVVLNILIMRIVFLFYKTHKENQNNLRWLVRATGINGQDYRESKKASATTSNGDSEKSEGSTTKLKKDNEENLQFSFITCNSKTRITDRKISNTISSVTTYTNSHSRPVNLGRTTLSQVRVTKMLVLVSSAFVILNLPSHAMRLYIFIEFLRNGDFTPTPKFALLMKLFEHLYYVNFSCNVFLYSVSGRNFRFACRQLWGRLKYNIVRVTGNCCKKCCPCSSSNKSAFSIIH